MLSVVIPAYNEEKTISRCLGALSRQTTDQEFEVILVDNNSTDATAQIAKKYSKVLQLQIIEEKKKGRSPARKKGFSAAREEIIFSTDADTTVPEAWIENMLTHFEDERIVAVTGTCYIDDCDWLTNKLATDQSGLN
jgi:glycosyltransferase involved in cell wall biosynthesis